MKRLLALAFVSLGLIGGGASLASSASAQPLQSAPAGRADVDDFSFASFAGDYTLSRAADGTALLTTVETFVADFPEFDQNKGIIRDIPDNYNGVPLSPDVTSVVDGKGARVPFEQSTDNGVVSLALGTDDYVTGTQTYVISYTERNVVRSFADTNSDELYRDTNGLGFDQPFGEVTASIHIADDLVPALTGNSACYVGEENSTTPCDINGGGSGVFTATAKDLGPGENLTYSIGFAKGTFVVPNPPTAHAWAHLVPIGLIVLILGTAVASILARTLGKRDAAGRGTIIAEYSVPRDENLLLAGNLVSRQSAALSAQLVSLAVRGNIYIVDDGDDDYSVSYINDANTDEQELGVLASLFGPRRAPGKLQKVGGTDNDLARALATVVARTPVIVRDRGWRVTAPRGVSGLLAAVLVGLLIASLVAFALVAVLSPVPTFAAGAALFIGVAGVITGAWSASRKDVLTDAGALRRDYIRGLEVYLKLAEADRFRILQSPEGAVRVGQEDAVDPADRTQVVKLYEKLLPYAVLWGVEREWAQELAIVYRDEAPDWYLGNLGFNAALFASSVSSFTSRASSAASVQSAGGGSFSGGSMGGGFSGGGGGGGGGGGR